MRTLLWFLAVLLVYCASPPHHILAEMPAAQPVATEPRRARVVIVVRDDCPKCEEQLKQLRRSGGPFESMKAVGWKIDTTPDSHIQIVNRKDVPQLANALATADYPAIAAIDGDEVTRYFKSGCTTPLDAWTFNWLLTGKNVRPEEPVAEPVRVATTGNYRLRGNHWSVDGDFNPSQEKVVEHLRGSNHSTSAAAYGNFETWSLEELRSLHDDLHERDGGLAGRVGARPSSSSRSNSSRPLYMTPKAFR